MKLDETVYLGRTMKLDETVYLGRIDVPVAKMWNSDLPPFPGGMGLYAVRVVEHHSKDKDNEGYQAEFFVLARSPKELKRRWWTNGTRMRPEVGEAIFDRGEYWRGGE